MTAPKSGTLHACFFSRLSGVPAEASSVRLFRLPVPNMIADLDQAPKERVDKPVWRVAFFGRLEERKGIKLFVDAVQVARATLG